MHETHPPGSRHRGAGYVGAVLTPRLLEKGYRVHVVDLFVFGEDVFDAVKGNPNLTTFKGDIRDQELLGRAGGVRRGHSPGCISNDPSFELNPTLGKSINFDSFEPLVHSARKPASIASFMHLPPAYTASVRCPTSMKSTP